MFPSTALRIACVLLIGCRDSGPEPPSNPERPALDAARTDTAPVAVFDAAPLDVAPLDAAPLRTPLDAARVDGARGDAARAGADPTFGVPTDATNQLGKHGDVCRSADGKPNALDEGRTVVECGPELSCCYPCGIAGCAWVCHTAAECDADLRRQ